MPPHLTSLPTRWTVIIFRRDALQSICLFSTLFIRLVLMMLFLLPRLAVMAPSDPLVATGETLIVHCTLRNYTGPYNASQIYYKMGNNTIDSSYVHILNNITAELRLPNMTRNHSGTHCFCYIKGYQLVLAHQVVTVAGRFESNTTHLYWLTKLLH